MTINDIKAGEYVVTALFWDEIISKPGQPFDFTRHRKGDTVDLDVEDARRLVLAGAVAKPGHVAEVPGTGPSEAPTGPTVAEPAAVGVFDPTEGGTIEATLAYVGDSSDRAAEMLEFEGDQDKPRSTLVEKLEAIIELAGS